MSKKSEPQSKRHSIELTTSSFKTRLSADYKKLNVIKVFNLTTPKFLGTKAGGCCKRLPNTFSIGYGEFRF